MPRNIQSELKQNKPFSSREEELVLNIIRTADQLQRGFSKLFNDLDLTVTKYNALRILRGAGEVGLACGEIGDRMVTRDPDITRLLDRLEKQGLISRSRDKEDRRVVTARIAAHGLDMLKKLDGPVAQLHRNQLGHLDPKQQEAIIHLLELVREKLSTDNT